MTTAPKMLHEAKEEFTEAVKRSKGKVVVLVHPFYLDYSPSDESWAQNAEQRQRHREIVLKLAKAHPRVPIVVLEEEGKAQQTHAVLSAPNSFYVNTYESNPNPVSGWKKLHRAFENSGVKTVLLGGQLAHKEHLSFLTSLYGDIKAHDAKLNRPPGSSIVRGCVAGAYNEIIEAKYAKVRLLPNLLFPDKPEFKRLK